MDEMGDEMAENVNEIEMEVITVDGNRDFLPKKTYLHQNDDSLQPVKNAMCHLVVSQRMALLDGIYVALTTTSSFARCSIHFVRIVAGDCDHIRIDTATIRAWN